MSGRIRDSGMQDAIREEAAEWLVVLRDPEVPAETLSRWERWMAVEANRQAFDEMVEISEATKRLKDIPLPSAAELADDRYDGDVPLSEWINIRQPKASLAHDRRSQSRRWAQITAPLAAVAAIVAAAGAWLAVESGMFSRPSHPAGQLVVYETAPAEHRVVRLEDGSEITLGAQTSISVSYSGHRRSIALSRGEALFRVARDPVRPFVVVAGQSTITALGTIFNVRRNDDRVVVSVAEGKVQVKPRAAAPAPDKVALSQPDSAPASAAAATLEPGDSISLTANGELGPIAHVESQPVIAWPEGRLIYRGEPLKHVIADVNRYSHRQLIIGDAAVGELLFSGIVLQDQIEQWAQGLSGVFPVELVETDGGHIVIRSRQRER